MVAQLDAVEQYQLDAVEQYQLDAVEQYQLDAVEQYFGACFPALVLRLKVKDDPFGYLKVRREERGLITWYESVLDSILPKVSTANMGTVKALCALPDSIRGYEHVKSQNIEQTKLRAQELQADLEKGQGTPRVIPVAVSL